MPLQSSVRVLKKPLRLDDEVRFLRSWIEKPLHMGAVMPSGKLLARTMAQYVDIESNGPVVELGPGTGAITSALIDRGVDQKRLVLVEYNPGFCALLRDRYPHAKVVQGDAYALRDSLLDILVIPGSLGSGSRNARLAAAASYQFAQAGADVTRVSLSDFPLPIYDGDLQGKSGVPKHAINLKRMMSAHHGVLIVTPEYNSSVPPLVKNAIDWVSRVQDSHETRYQVFRGRPFAIAAASESRLGGTRCLAALRLILSACQATVIPNQLALSFAGEAYDDMDRLKHPADVEALGALARQLLD